MDLSRLMDNEIIEEASIAYIKATNRVFWSTQS